MIKATLLFWVLYYYCFNFNMEDLNPAIKEYTELIHLKPPYSNKIFFKKGSEYRKILAQLMGVKEEVINRKKKEKGKKDCFHWSFFRDYICEHYAEDQA